MKKRLVGIILASLLVVLVGINALAFPVKKAQIPKPQTTVSTQKVLDTLTAKELLPFAQAGNAEAQYHLGLAYKTGDGVPGGADFQLKALKEGCVHPPIFDAEKMAYWFQKAAEQGHSDAQFWLGLSYYKNEGVPWDENKAVYWFQKSAEQGNAGAQNNLGVMYEKGQGIPLDYKKAVYYYQKSAEQGVAEAQVNLGVMYHFGQGVPQNFQKAIYWYQKSAEQGYATAQRNLAVILSVYGENLPQDIQKAYVWASLAAAQGEQKASELRDRIAKQLTSKQLTEAQEWARDWDEKIQAKKAQTPE